MLSTDSGVQLIGQLGPETYFRYLGGPVASVFAAIALVALGFAIATAWLDKRDKSLKSELSKSFGRQIESLNQRVAHLERCHADALAHIVTAVGMAGEIGEVAKPLRERLTMAAEALR